MTTPTDCRGCGTPINPHVTGELCQTCWAKLDTDTLRAVAAPDAATDPVMWRHGATHDALDGHLAHAYAWVDDVETLTGLATNPACPLEVLTVLQGHRSPAVATAARQALTDRTATAGETATALAVVDTEDDPDTTRDRRGWVIPAVAALLAVVVALGVTATSGTSSTAAEPPTTTRPAVTTTTEAPVRAQPVVVGTIAEGLRRPITWPRSYPCAAGTVTVRVNAASAPLNLWVSGTSRNQVKAPASVEFDQPVDGDAHVVLYGPLGTLVDVDVICSPLTPEGDPEGRSGATAGTPAGG